MRVAVYARVSTEHEAQINALENQLEWYKIECSRHSDWEIVEVYVDQGITGTQAQKRPEFLRMMENTAWLNALYTDVYEYSGKYSNQVAWERFTEYMVFYDEVVDYNNELAPAPALYDVYYAYDPATEEEAALCVDDVIQIAEESGAEIQIW
ncbi:MAG: recombinase family protein [Faecalibacterium sp.]